MQVKVVVVTQTSKQYPSPIIIKPPPEAGNLGDQSVSKKTLCEHHGQQQNQTKLEAVKSQGRGLMI